ncbi:MAG: XisI protein [Verrucomicrobia bacterium]|nr:XisI protein [Cytophagales bacterium]
MEKALKYESALLTFLKDYAPIVPHGWKNVRNQMLVDKENKHYQLMRVGWHDDKRIHYIVFHFDIVGDKVWIQQNRTDLPVVQELEDLGIPEEDVVLGFWRSGQGDQALA